MMSSLRWGRSVTWHDLPILQHKSYVMIRAAESESESESVGVGSFGRSRSWSLSRQNYTDSDSGWHWRCLALVSLACQPMAHVSAWGGQEVTQAKPVSQWLHRGGHTPLFPWLSSLFHHHANISLSFSYWHRKWNSIGYLLWVRDTGQAGVDPGVGVGVGVDSVGQSRSRSRSRLRGSESESEWPKNQSTPQAWSWCHITCCLCHLMDHVMSHHLLSDPSDLSDGSCDVTSPVVCPFWRFTWRHIACCLPHLMDHSVTINPRPCAAFYSI